jgi:hypothetical protein
MSHTKTAVCITTFNRVDCARINMEIIKLNYANKWPIVHACSDKSYKKYIENILVKCEPKALQAGAFDLLKNSILTATETYNPEYIVHLEADTWLMNQELIEKYITMLSNNSNAVIASSSWSFDKSEKWRNSKSFAKRLAYFLTRLTKRLGLTWHIGWQNTIASQFFIVKNTPEFRELLSTMAVPSDGDYLEKYLFSKITKRFGRKSILWMKEREPVHPNNRDSCEDMALFCQHFPSSQELTFPENKHFQLGKKEILEKYPLMTKGIYMEKLLRSSDTSYYNPGAKRH